MWYNFLAGGFCAAVGLLDLLEQRWVSGTALSVLSILNIVLGAITL